MENKEISKRIILDKLQFYIENGIENRNGTIREFDYLDYMDLTDVSVEELDKFWRKEDYHFRYNDKIRNFFSKNKTASVLSTIDVEYLLKELYEIDCKRDKKGFPMPGTGRIITKEEKLAAIDFVINNGYPLTDKTYNCALKRILKGYMFIDIKKYQDLDVNNLPNVKKHN